jgi:hypothetical protein
LPTSLGRFGSCVLAAANVSAPLDSAPATLSQVADSEHGEVSVVALG